MIWWGFFYTTNGILMSTLRWRYSLKSLDRTSGSLCSRCERWPRLPISATTLPPAARVVHLHNLQRLYLEQGDLCDIGWMLIHLIIPASTNVRIFTDLDHNGQPVVHFELVLDLALPSHPGFPHFANLRRGAYAIDVGPRYIITATSLAFGTAWKGLTSLRQVVPWSQG